jgi:hypothetical protein
LHETLAIVLVMVEKYDLTITSSNAKLITGYSLNASYTLGTYVLGEYKHFILDLEANEISRCSSSEEEFFTWLGEGKAAVLSDIGTSREKFLLGCSVLWVDRPKSELLGATDSKLVIGCVSKFDVLDHTSPLEALNFLSKDLWNNRQ